MDWPIFSSATNPATFTAHELYKIEKSSMSYLDNKMKTSPTFNNQNIYSTDVDVRRQTNGPGPELVSIAAEVTIIYEGDEKQDFSDAISKIFKTSDSQILLNTLVNDGLFESGSQASTPTFTNASTLTLDESHHSQLLFIILISLVGILVLTSSGVLLSAVCKRKNKDSEDDTPTIKQTNTFDTVESNSPGKLGARRNIIPESDMSAYAITPVKRGGRRAAKTSTAETPGAYSSVSDMISPAGSMASRNPLGIMRLSTLNRVEVGGKNGRQSNVQNMGTMYRISLDESNNTEDVERGEI